MDDPLRDLEIPPDSWRPIEWRTLAREAEQRFSEAIAQASGGEVQHFPEEASIDFSSPEIDDWVYVEFALWRDVPQNLGNRLTETLAKAVRLRRAYPRSVSLALVAVVVSNRETDRPWDRPGALDRFLDLVRREETDAGFDGVVLAWRAPDRPTEWFEIRRNETSTALSFAGVVEWLRELGEHPQSLEPEQETSTGADGQDQHPEADSFLLVADEWVSGRGGISTFNRELAKALAASGSRVQVVVPDATRQDRDDARKHGVELLAPVSIPGISGNQLLLTTPGPSYEIAYPNAIVGHGRILGPYAYALQNQHFRRAKRIHVVHMDTERLEFVKEKPGGQSAIADAQARLAVEVELAISADVVAGVGPLLAESIADSMRGKRGVAPPVIEIRPGLRDWGGVVDPADPPAQRRILLVGRADDFVSKGIDIAVRAVVRAIALHGNQAGDLPTLVVRGLPDVNGEAIRTRLDSIAAPDTRVIARPYSSDEEDLRADLWQARLVLMPSRHEGFGLVAHEAIAAGVPVLVSRESGVGRLINEVAKDGDRVSCREVLPIAGPDDEVVEAWGDAIHSVLIDPRAAYERAAELRSQIAETTTWDKAVGAISDALDAL